MCSSMTLYSALHGPKLVGSAGVGVGAGVAAASSDPSSLGAIG